MNGFQSLTRWVPRSMRRGIGVGLAVLGFALLVRFIVLNLPQG